MAKGKKAADTTPAPPAVEPPPGPAPAKKTTQKDAVRRAIEAGHDKPKEGVMYIKEKYGMDLTPQNFSTLKTILKKKEGTNVSTGRRGRPAASQSAAKPVPASSAVELAQTIKGLCKKHGADTVIQMATLFSD